ncbi:MAG: ribonuclease P protein component [Weeksellaceae bacterium]
MRYTLGKKESLKSKKYFDALFAQGSSVKRYPIRAIFIAYNQDNFPEYQIPNVSQVAFSVPKKRFKRAVDRNRIKRQMREAYRLNKFLLDENYAIIFVYLAKEEMTSIQISEAITQILKDINTKIPS